MRKKLLRSRSGFEKPESREEAIMQNILGASNVLEPSESNIEEILKSILYNTPYTKEAEFEIEKILLAIKNNGTYDGEGESRDMKILIAILNDLDYTEETESRIEELFIEWLHQRSSIKVLEGVPPLTFTSRGLPLINYLIEGNTVQNGTPTPASPIIPQETGERTGNLCNLQSWTNTTTDTKSYFQLSITLYNGSTSLGERRFDVHETGRVALTSATAGADGATRLAIKHNGSTRDLAIGNVYDDFPANQPLTISFDVSGYDPTIAGGISISNIMLNTGSAALPYEKFGYKIPISSAGQTTPIYLGEVETERKVKKLVLTGNETITTYTYSSTLGVLVANMLDAPHRRGQGYCNIYPVSTQSGSIRCLWIGSGGTDNNLYFVSILDEMGFTTVDEFKAYLAAQYAAGTPVCVWYVLSTPQTAVVNEPLRKIGAYVDSISKAQAGVEIPTVNGSNTLDVDTTLKPSNIYIEYK